MMMQNIMGISLRNYHAESILLNPSVLIFVNKKPSLSTNYPDASRAADRQNSLLTTGSDINALILDYLTMEGYPQAAANFSKEANLQPQQDKSFVHARQQIRSAIHNGKIDEAIILLNHFNPEVSFGNSYLDYAVSCPPPVSL